MRTGEQLDVIAQVLENFTVPEFRRGCESCGRGAAELPVPDNEDIAALYEIYRGFDGYRRNFTPEMEERMKRVRYCIGYLNNLQAGSQ